MFLVSLCVVATTLNCLILFLFVFPLQKGLTIAPVLANLGPVEDLSFRINPGEVTS